MKEGLSFPEHCHNLVHEDGFTLIKINATKLLEHRPRRDREPAVEATRTFYVSKLFRKVRKKYH